MSGTLFIVATPIGNLQDISLRAIQTLFSVDVIACEDTRRAGVLLKKLEEYVVSSNFSVILSETKDLNKEDSSHSFRMTQEGWIARKPRLISYYDQVEQQKTPEIINMLLQGLNVALISDAGTPLVSDPGYRVVKEVISSGIQVTSIPGPTAVISALTLSGLPSDKFFFLGYLPKKAGHRKELLESLKGLQGQLKTTAIFYEAPHRIKETLSELYEVLGSEKYIVVARELTKTYEEVQRGSIKEILQHFEQAEPKGEFVILFNTED